MAFLERFSPQYTEFTPKNEIAKNIVNILSSRKGFDFIRQDFGMECIEGRLEHISLNECLIESIKTSIKLFEPRLVLSEVSIKREKRSNLFRISILGRAGSEEILVDVFLDIALGKIKIFMDDNW